MKMTTSPLSDLTLMGTERETNGFVVEVNEKTVTFLTLERGVVELPINTDVDTPELCQTHFIDLDDGYYDVVPKSTVPDFKIFVKDGAVHAQLFAIGPNLLQLPREIRKKYKKAVWSPHLKYMSDKNDIFADAVKGGEVGEVIAKYSPSEELFEIVEVIVWEEEPDQARLSIYHQNPWIIETLAFHTKPVHEIAPDFMGSIKRRRPFCSEERTIGVCIAHWEPNPLFKESIGEPFMSLLWSPKFGLTRWMIKQPRGRVGNMSSEDLKENQVDKIDERAEQVLGHWFAFSLHDVCAEKYITAALDPVEVDVEKPFKIVKNPNMNGDGYMYSLEMEVSFGFRRADVVKTNILNRKEPSATDETKDLCEGPYSTDETKDICEGPFSVADIKDSAHFIDLELGRVDIDATCGALILNKIAQHYEEMRQSNPEKFAQRENEPIIVTSTVTVIDKYQENADRYPDCGLFIVQSVDCIFYLHGGETIWKK
ncbi:unnamed protein product [Caenorhabditis brenneri]